MTAPLHIIGGGLAGCEAAWQAARRDLPVVLHEMRPILSSPAHVTDGLAELVCSNSFRSDDAEANAVGVLHEELRRAGSLIMRAADATSVPAGGALAVDREGFSARVTDAIAAHPQISVERGEVSGLPPDEWGEVIIATGPLTSDALAAAIAEVTGSQALAFFDAIAPIVHFHSIDMDIAWFQSRYDRVGTDGSTADYINCPMDRNRYEAFVEALLTADQHEHHPWEKIPYFDGCLPIEVMAERGRETLRFGPMKPVGLTNPRQPDVKPHAIVQLRQDNALGTLYNIVGFQTKMKYRMQADIFRMIPGLEHAEFARLGGMHRNTFLDSPKLLDPTFRLKAMPRLRFAGQITGCEGYVESAAVGLLAGRFAAEERRGRVVDIPPATTALGALQRHITGGHASAEAGVKTPAYQPMNVNFGLFPPVEVPLVDGRKPKGKTRGAARKRALAARALVDVDLWLGSTETG